MFGVGEAPKVASCDRTPNDLNVCSGPQFISMKSDGSQSELFDCGGMLKTVVSMAWRWK